MKRINKENINTPHYFDKQFRKKHIDKVNLLRQERYLEEIFKMEKVDRIVELACGISYFCPLAAKAYPEVWGVDFAKHTIKRLKKFFPKVNYVEGNATNTPFQDNYFDVVVAGEIIEHLENPIDLIMEMYRIVKNGGLIIISTAKVEFKDPEHIWEIGEKDLQKLFKGLGDLKTEVVKSELFKGREYAFAFCYVKK